ncbi:MAG: glycerophosphodiester phosphodiesterase family protein [Leadbetterella sp.]
MKTLGFILLLMSMELIISPPATFEIQGHRGCRGLMPENTIPAFLHAVQLGVDVLELDVIISKDHQVLVSHDPFFEPKISISPDGKEILKAEEYNTYTMTYAEIKKFDVGTKKHINFPEQANFKTHKPLLRDVITEVEQYCKKNKRTPPKYNIELKSLEKEYDKSQPQPAIFCDLILKTIGHTIPSEKLCLQSFDFNILKLLNKYRGKSKKFTISALIEPEENNEININIDKLGFTPDIWSPHFSVLNAERVNRLHTLKIQVIPWTVNSVEDMQKVKALGCDGLITDYPNRAIKL